MHEKRKISGSQEPQLASQKTSHLLEQVINELLFPIIISANINFPSMCHGGEICVARSWDIATRKAIEYAENHVLFSDIVNC